MRPAAGAQEGSGEAGGLGLDPGAEENQRLRGEMRPRLGGDPPGDKGATTSLQSDRLYHSALGAVGGEGSWWLRT